MRLLSCVPSPLLRTLVNGFSDHPSPYPVISAKIRLPNQALSEAVGGQDLGGHHSVHALMFDSDLPCVFQLEKMTSST
jgi:hypothetical protein